MKTSNNNKAQVRDGRRAPISDFPQKRAMKIEIAKQIAAYIRDNDITQTQLAVDHGIDQGIMSKICNANLDGFTVDRLVGIAETVGIAVDVKFHGD